MSEYTDDANLQITKLRFSYRMECPNRPSRHLSKNSRAFLASRPCRDTETDTMKIWASGRYCDKMVTQ